MEDLDFEDPDVWYTGPYCNRFPFDRPVTVGDILPGWKPAAPIIHADTKVLALGSCFAEYFVKFLAESGYNRWQLPVERHAHSEESLLPALPGTLENVFVIVQQFRWAFNEFTPGANLWFTKNMRQFEATDERRNRVRRSFEEGDVFVITLGHSEIWFDQTADEPMWRTIPARYYERDRYICRPATVGQTLAALYAFDALVDKFMAGKRFVFTLSPIPLIATFRDQSPVTANQASKAILRAALDEFMADGAMAGKARYHYFPSYEIVHHLFDHPFLPDNRHIRPEVARTVLEIFSNLYTDLPTKEVRVPSENVHVSSLEERVRGLEAELRAKERVIRELDLAARQRLALIYRLTGDPEAAASEDIPASPPSLDAGPGMAHFFSPHYEVHNRARLEHLRSLGLPLAGKRVIELGSGPGDHTEFYVERGCSVVSVDVRQECLDVLTQRFPDVFGVKCDLNHTEALRDLGTFDIVHCYGILYHLEEPEALLRYIAESCTGIAIIETCVSVARGSAVEMVDELRDDYTQSSTGRACRPTRQWLFSTLSGLFPFVYHTKTQPAHPEFPTEWTDIEDVGGLVRSVFVASVEPLDLPALSSTLLDTQEQLQ